MSAEETESLADAIREADAHPPGAKPAPTDAIVDRWFHEQIHNSVASRDTAIVNHLTAAKEDLKRRLRKES